MSDNNVCPSCNTRILSRESLFCHKCGARLEINVFQFDKGAPPSFSSASPENTSDAGKSIDVKEINDQNVNAVNTGAENKRESVYINNITAGDGEISGDVLAGFKRFQKNYYRSSFPVALIILFFSLVYAASPYDIIYRAPLINWIDDTLIIACAFINLLHCGIDINKHSENIMFQRIKLMVIPLGAAVIFFMWFCVNIVLIIFQK